MKAWCTTRSIAAAVAMGLAKMRPVRPFLALGRPAHEHGHGAEVPAVAVAAGGPGQSRARCPWSATSKWNWAEVAARPDSRSSPRTLPTPVRLSACMIQPPTTMNRRGRPHTPSLCGRRGNGSRVRPGMPAQAGTVFGVLFGRSGQCRGWSATRELCQVGMMVGSGLVSSHCRPDVVILAIEGRALRRLGLGVSGLSCPSIRVAAFRAKLWRLVSPWRTAGPDAGYENGALRGAVFSSECPHKHEHPTGVDWCDRPASARAFSPRY